MKRWTLIVGSIVIILAITAFKSSEQSNSHSQVLLRQYGYHLNISYSDKEFETRDTKKLVSSVDDVGPILKKVSELKSQGWMIVSSGVVNNQGTWVHMEKNN